MDTKKEHINPDGLFKSSAFSQVVTTQGNGKTIYIGGQNSVNKNLEIIGKGNLSKQTEQVMVNIKIALESCGADFSDLVKLNINLIQGQDATTGFEASQKFLNSISELPVITVLFVGSLGRPDFLVEIDAIAFIPEVRMK